MYAHILSKNASWAFLHLYVLASALAVFFQVESAVAKLKKEIEEKENEIRTTEKRLEKEEGKQANKKTNKRTSNALSIR